MRATRPNPRPEWVPQPIVNWVIASGRDYLPQAKGQLVSFITDLRMKAVWEELDEAKLQFDCDRNEALQGYADTAMRGVSLLSQHMPELTKAQVSRSLCKIEKLAEGMREQLRLLGPLKAPIRFLPLSTQDGSLGAVTVDNVPWHGLIRIAMSAPGEWQGYTDLEFVLGHEQISRACDEVLAQFAGIYPTWINSPGAKAITLRNLLQDSMTEYFRDPIDGAISATVDVLFPSTPPSETAGGAFTKPITDGKEVTRQLRKRRRGK